MLTRRRLLTNFGATAGVLALAESVLADPYGGESAVRAPDAARFAPVRVTGRVTDGNRGLEHVGVSDGRAVVATDADGIFEMISATDRPFVFVCPPAGYAIPTSPFGTARLHVPLAPDARGEMTAHFALNRLETPDGEHAFFLMADPQTADAEDVRLLHEQSEVLGNHDVDLLARSDETSGRSFERHFGPTYYAFDRGEVHYVVLDDVFWFGSYIGYVSQQQLDWLAADLARVESGRTVVVFVHIPRYCEIHLRHDRESPENRVVITNRELLYKILEPYQGHVIFGHMHESEYLRDGGCQVHVCGAVCSAWWSGPICPDGTPNGYSVYQVKGSELRWQYKCTGHPWSHQMRLYPPGTDPGAPTN